MAKTAAVLFLVIVIAGALSPFAVLADGSYEACQGEITNGACSGNWVTVYYEGFVPCGKLVTIAGGTGPYERVVNCQFCHLFIMANNIIAYALVNIVPPLAILMLVVGGVMFYFGGTKPGLITRGKSIITGVVIGLVLVYGAYMIVGLLLTVLGVSDWTGLTNWQNGVFSINCPVTIPTSP